MNAEESRGLQRNLTAVIVYPVKSYISQAAILRGGRHFYSEGGFPALRLLLCAKADRPIGSPPVGGQ